MLEKMENGSLGKFPSFFATNVFTDKVMKARISDEAYIAFHHTIEEGSPLSVQTASIIANAMMEWAIERGATHYTHWFQPLTGVTAEKHDSFINVGSDGQPITKFSGKALIKGEPDASSFPSGGLRATFEARGYTAWDPTSPAFLKEDAAGVTLCIPTAFCSYTGFALDKKTPLLKSTEALSKQALRVLKLFGHKNVKRIITTAGAEQEYFLVDRQTYKQRQDLVCTGRTIFGAKPPKGQEMDDHYFGNLKDRVACFMHELDIELWKLGVYAKTKHNESAPAQHELAPIFTEVNLATDHNQLIMETMRRVAKRHDLKCLLHEKPFAHINGSGKHNNWAIATDDGQNLLEPGKTPHENAQFLLFLCAVIRAIDIHAELLRASAANAGNDYRLGASEAPPAIISIFLGDQLTDILEHIELGDGVHKKFGGKLEIGVAILPDLPKDSTDRNRTSPFAFTGNKFEFRMVPSSASIAGPNTVLNTIIADSLKNIADKLEGAKDFNGELDGVIRDILKKHKRIIFNGNGYSGEWIEEAAKRGLPNINNTVDAYPAFISEKSIEVFETHSVYSKMELMSRFEIKMEKYIKIVNIEARTMLEMCKRQILPACMKFSSILAREIISLKEVGFFEGNIVQKQLLDKYLVALNDAYSAVEQLEKSSSDEALIESLPIMERGAYYRDKVVSAMATVRQYVDELETMTSSEIWPMPTYSELLFNL